jgi:predicted dehydrogenase
MSSQPLRMAIIGMGGFARNHHQAAKVLEFTSGEVQLVATCDPQPEKFDALQSEMDFAGRGVQIYRDYREMLDAHSELHFATVPTPIPLHAPMHRACIERGLGCYLEKPPTLIPEELEAMIEAEAGAKFQAQVGFNFIVEQGRRVLKRRLLAGDFGRLKRVVFLGFWPRSTAYYTRSPWAGRLILGERAVMDSCTGNAVAHYVHNALYWCGEGAELSWGDVREVEAELYRAHAIESFDTAFLRAQCGDDVQVHIAATHAGSGRSWQQEWIECEHATISYDTGRRHYVVRWNDGRIDEGFDDDLNLMVENLRYYARYLRGEESLPLTTLSNSRPFVHLNALAFVAAGNIHTVNTAFIDRTPVPGSLQGEEAVAIQGIETALEAFGRTGQMPSEGNSQRREWGQSGGVAQASQLPQWEAVVRRLQRETVSAS